MVGFWLRPGPYTVSDATLDLVTVPLKVNTIYNTKHNKNWHIQQQKWTIPELVSTVT